MSLSDRGRGAVPVPDTPVRVVIADDGVLLREGVANVLGRFGFSTVVAVDDGLALVAAVREHNPDLVVTDIRMPPDHTDEGLRAALALRVERPDLPVVLLSQYAVPGYAADLLESGDGRSVGYLLKDRVGDVRDFVADLRRVVDGGTAVDPQLVRHLMRRGTDPISALTDRERQVLALMAAGHSNRAISELLRVTEAAVGKHIGNIMAKLDLPPDGDTNRRVRAVLAYLNR